MQITIDTDIRSRLGLVSRTALVAPLVQAIVTTDGENARREAEHDVCDALGICHATWSHGFARGLYRQRAQAQQNTP